MKDCTDMRPVFHVPAAPPRIPALDGLRAVAILFVLVGHAVRIELERTHSAPWERLYSLAAYFANSGVHLFFCISGFLITTLLLREKSRHDRISIGSFYRRRILRIWPAFFFYLGVLAILHATGQIGPSLVSICVAGLFMWNYWIAWAPQSEPADWFVGHTWSLAVEQHFYLLWPWIAQSLTVNGIRVFCVCGLVLASIVRWVSSWLLDPAQDFSTVVMTHGACDALLTGAFVATLNLETDRNIVRWVRRYWVLFAALVFLFFPTVYFLKFGDLLHWPATNAIRAIGLSMVLFVLVTTPTMWLAKVLELRGLRLIGAISYSLYLWQQLFLTALTDHWFHSIWLKLIASFGFAVGSFYFIEQPFLRKK